MSLSTGKATAKAGIGFEHTKCIKTVVGGRSACTVGSGFKMNKRTRKRAERVAAVIEKIMADYKANIGELAEKSFADCRVTVTDEEGSRGGAFVTLTYDGAGYDYWSCYAEYDVGFRTELDEKLRKIDKDLYFEDCNTWSLSIYIEGR